MSIWSKIKDAYNRVDRAVGGYLPGGATPSQVKSGTSGSSSSSSSTPSSSSSSSSTSSTSTNSTSTNSTRSYSSGGGSSGSSSITIPQSVLDQINQQNQQNSLNPTDQTVQNYGVQEVPDSVKNITISSSSGSSRSSTPAASSSAASVDLGNQATSSGSKSPQPATVSAAPAITQVQKPYDIRDDMTFGQKVGSVFDKYTSFDFYQGVAQTLTGTGSDGKGPRPISAFTQFVSPFDIFGSTQTAGDLDITGVYQGTGIYNQTTGQYEAPKKTGYQKLNEDILANPDIAKNPVLLSQETSSNVVGELQPKYQEQATSLGQSYQARINTGELSLSQAESLYAADLSKLQGQFETEATSLYEARIGPKIDAYSQFSGRYNDLTKSVSVAPSTAITTGALVASSFVGGSEVAALRSAYRVVSGAVAIEGVSNVGEGLQTGNYLQAGLGAAMFVGGTYSLFRSLAAEETLASIQGATGQKPRLISGSRTELRPDQYMDQFSYVQSTSNARAVTRETVFSTFNPQSNTFRITSGSSETTVKAIDAWTGKDIYVGSYRTFTGGGAILPKGYLGANTNIAGVTIAQENLIPSLSRITSTTQYSYRFVDSLQSTPTVVLGGRTQTILGGAESLLKDNKIISKSGPANFGADVTRGRGFAAYENVGGGYSPDTLTILKLKGSDSAIYFEPFPNTGLRGNVGGGGSQTLTSLQTQILPSAPLPTQTVVKDIAKQFGAGTALVPASGAAVQIQGNLQAAAILEPQADIQAKTRGRSDYAFGAQILQDIRAQQDMMPQTDVRAAQDVFAVGRSAQMQSPGLIQLPKLDQAPGQQLKQEQLQIPALVTPGANVPFSPFFDTDFIRPGLPGLGEPEFGFPGIGKVKGGRQRVKYTPDFTSLVFNIEGPAPKGGASPNPFAARPIPRGFSFAFSEGSNNFQDIFKNLPGVPGLPKPKPKRKRRK